MKTKMNFILFILLAAVVLVVCVLGAEASIVAELTEDQFIYPTNGRLIRTFGWYLDPVINEPRFNQGINFQGKTDTHVYAAKAGIVIYIGFDKTIGTFMIINHDNIFKSLYAHLSTVSVKQGDTVTQESLIGEVGNTGRSLGSQLHFRIYNNGIAVDPMSLLQSRK